MNCVSLLVKTGWLANILSGRKLCIRTGIGCDLTMLRPLWQLFTKMENNTQQDQTGVFILPPLHRALTELFYIAEKQATELGVLHDYFLALTTEDHIHHCVVQGLKNVAAISLAINHQNKATRLLSEQGTSQTKPA